MITLPHNNVRVLGPVSQLDYIDSQSVTCARPVTALEAWNVAMGKPLPLMRLAFWLRDVVSARFGVRKIGGFSGQRVETVAAGDRLDFFTVEHVSDDVLVLTERDRHLDVMTCISCIGTMVTITSSVLVHNGFGRAYMLPVGLAHRWIVRATLRRLGAGVV